MAAERNCARGRQRKVMMIYWSAQPESSPEFITQEHNNNHMHTILHFMYVHLWLSLSGRVIYIKHQCARDDEWATPPPPRHLMLMDGGVFLFFNHTYVNGSARSDARQAKTSHAVVACRAMNNSTRASFLPTARNRTLLIRKFFISSC